MHSQRTDDTNRPRRCDFPISVIIGIVGQEGLREILLFYFPGNDKPATRSLGRNYRGAVVNCEAGLITQRRGDRECSVVTGANKPRGNLC